MPDMHRMLVILLTLLTLCSIADAQDTLPRFSVTVRGAGKVLVSWHNSFSTVTQISIQRSSDSLKDFTTLITVPDPSLPENGVVDAKAPHPNFFYRIFIVLQGGNYLFSHSQRPHATAVAEQQKEKPKDPRDIGPEEEEVNMSRMDNQRIRFAGDSKQRLQINTLQPTFAHCPA